MKDIDKNIVALGFVSFFTDMASSMITSILPLYIVYILHEGVDKLGFVVGIATFVSYGFRFVFGYLSDKFHIVKPFVVIGYALSAITKPLLYFSESWVSVALLRGLERVGKAIRSATKDTLISAYSKKNSSGKTFGFHKTMDIAGELSGSVIAFLLLFYVGESERIFKDIFAFTLIPGIFAMIVVIFFVKDVPYIKRRFSGEEEFSSFDLKQDYRLLSLLFIYFGFIFFIFNDSFYILSAKEAGYKIAYIPLLVILLNLVQTIFSYYFGITSDKFGEKRVLFASFLFGITSMFCIYQNFIVIGYILLALFLISSINSARAYISSNATNKGTIFGLFYAGVAISGAIGAFVTGILWSHYGKNFAELFSLGGMITIIFIYALSKKSRGIDG